MMDSHATNGEVNPREAHQYSSVCFAQSVREAHQVPVWDFLIKRGRGEDIQKP